MRTVVFAAIAIASLACAGTVFAGDGLTATGPEPPGECPPYPPAKTGQTECWDEHGYLIDCAGTGQDGEYQKGVSVGKRFTDNGDGTVTDNLTGLIWVQDRFTNCLPPTRWEWSVEWVNSLAEGLCGLTDGSVPGDWRMPNVRELQSLIDYGQVDPALPVGHPFTNVVSGRYWTSTSYVQGPDAALQVFLWTGLVNGMPKHLSYFTWPVRGPE